MHAMISYVIPTRNRPLALRRTLWKIAALRTPGEVIVIDNDSHERLVLPAHLPGSLRVRAINLPTNLGAAARNIGVREANPASRWVVMLDDDSHPIDASFVRLLDTLPPDVAAASADIFVRRAGRRARELGGLPEVFIGCGAAIRRDVFLQLAGYDASFGCYAEEYDLCARLLLAGYRVAFLPRFRVMHRRAAQGRKPDSLLFRLTRNSLWVVQRYAPDSERREAIRQTLRRCRVIARREHALAGYLAGTLEARRTLSRQPRTPMPQSIWDRFIGLSHARHAIAAALNAAPFAAASLVDRGKNAWVIRRAMTELGVRVESHAPVRVIGTLSPGPMLDAWARRLRQTGVHGPRIVLPWLAPSAHDRRRRAA
jgi:GT2 family glycosyltransferase